MRTAYNVFWSKWQQRSGQITHILQRIYLALTPELEGDVANGVGPTRNPARGQISLTSNHHLEMRPGSNLGQDVPAARRLLYHSQ